MLRISNETYRKELKRIERYEIRNRILNLKGTLTNLETMPLPEDNSGGDRLEATTNTMIAGVRKAVGALERYSIIDGEWDS